MTTSVRLPSSAPFKPDMDFSNLDKQHEPEEPRYLDFPCAPDGATRDGKPVLNKYSSTITKDHDFPGAQVLPPMVYLLFGTDVVARLCSTPPAYPTSSQ